MKKMKNKNCLRGVSEESFLFNGNIKIIYTTLKFLIKVRTQKAEFLLECLHKSDIPNQFQKLFTSVLWYCFKIMLLKLFSTIFSSFWICIKYLFMLSTSYKSHMIRYSSTGHAFKHVQKALEHLRHSGTWALGHLRHSDTWALRVLRHFSTRPLKAFGHLGAWELKALYLADSLRKVILSITLIIFD